MSDEKRHALECVTGHVSRETFDRLIAFEMAFKHWAERINLTARSTLDDLWSRHIIDSAQVLRLAPTVRDWVDAGTGGGFPGAVVAILVSERPDVRVRLVESAGKKCAFLRTVLSELAPRAEIHCRRIETSVADWHPPEMVTARALAPLDDLVRLLARWLENGSRALFHKGRDYRGEIERARDSWNLDLIEHPSVVDSSGAILEIVRLRRR